MIVLTPASFTPSSVLIDMLLWKLFPVVDPSVVPTMRTYTREQLKYGFAASLDAIKERRVLNTSECKFLVVDRDCNIREELVKEIKIRAALHIETDYDRYEFRLRLGEEVRKWFLCDPTEAKMNKLFSDEFGNIFLQREEYALDEVGFA